MNQAPIVDFTIDIARSVADQCICHPASRSVDDIERAGEAIKYLLWVIEKTRATAAVELDRAQRGEPVAWIWRFSDGELHKTPFGTLAECERDAIGYDGSAVPLYTAPQPSQPAHTEAEVQELMEFAKHHALGTFSDALAAQPSVPAWNDVPTCSGVWVNAAELWAFSEGEISGLRKNGRWFGPLPEDTK